jgi:hypothetical protein
MSGGSTALGTQRRNGNHHGVLEERMLCDLLQNRLMMEPMKPNATDVCCVHQTFKQEAPRVGTREFRLTLMVGLG